VLSAPEAVSPILGFDSGLVLSVFAERSTLLGPLLASIADSFVRLLILCDEEESLPWQL